MSVDPPAARRARESQLLGIQFTVAAWVLGALITVNSGSLLAVLNALKDHPELAGAAAPFIMGVLLAFACAASMWANAFCHGQSAAGDRYGKSSVWERRWDVAGAWLVIVALALLAASVVSFACGAFGVQQAYAAGTGKHEVKQAAAQSAEASSSHIGST
jgi:hypothetical protein